MIKALFVLVLAGVAAVAIGLVALMAFDNDDDSDPDGTTGGVASTAGPGGGLSAQDVLQQSAARSEEVMSFHFILTHENGSTPLPLGLQLETAEGDVGVPDRLAAEVEAEAVGINVDVEVIGIEGRTWVTNPFTRGWQELPDTNIRDFANPAALVSGLLPSIMNPELSEGGSVDGVDTHQVTGTIDSGALQDALGIAEPGREVEVEAWIGKDDMLPRRVRLIGPLSDAEDADVVRQVELSRFDEPVEIMPPE
jgi:LppX/LprAFG-like lipoprotein